MKKHHYTRERILLNAMEIFTLKGFDETKMYEVAEASSSPLYILLELFEDKTGMYKHCLEYADSVIESKTRDEQLIEAFRKSLHNKNEEYRHSTVNPFMPISIF